MEIWPWIVLALVGLAMFVPYQLTRACLHSVAVSFPDPRTPQAAWAVRRAAQACLFFTLLTGSGFSAWCFYRAASYPRGPLFDITDVLWKAAGCLPVWVLFQVAVASFIPIKVSLPVQGPGFRRR